VGFFGILSDNPAAELEVGRFDINVWCLPKIAGRYSFYCDIGIELTPKNATKQLSLALPFQTSGLEDLVPRLAQNSNIAGLVFGEPVSTLAERITVKKEELHLGYVDVDGSELDRRRSYEAFSLWRLQFSNELKAVEKAYIRVRFRIKSLGRFWVWQTSRARGRTAVVDVRVGDLREAVVLRNAQEYASRLVTVKRLNCFVMIPVAFERRLCSPEVRYLRLLEGEVWKDYLPKPTKGEKILVQYWRGENVGKDSEFRGLLHIAAAPARMGWDAFALAVAAALVVVLLLAKPGELQDSLAAGLVVFSEKDARRFWLAVIVPVIGGIIYWLASNPDASLGILAYLRRLWDRITGRHPPD
jgi:hypothetical protein